MKLDMHKNKNIGRNVINIKEINDSINSYCKEKNLPKEIQTWLLKNFLRWLINHFSHVKVVQSNEVFYSLLKRPTPSWFLPQSTKVKFIYIDNKHHKFIELLDKTTEYLSSIYPKSSYKFSRMTVEQVLIKWQEDHNKMLNKKRLFIETSGEALEHIFSFGNFNVVKFLSKNEELSLEMSNESSSMQHCLGEFDDIKSGKGGYGEYYIDLIRENKIELYSIRDEKNRPHVTIATYKENSKLWLDQIKGKQNRSPIEIYIPVSKAFLNYMDINYGFNNDTLRMGLVYDENKTKSISEIEDEKMKEFLVSYDSKIIHQIKNPSKSLLWLAILREPNEIISLSNTTDAMKISSLIQSPILMTKLRFSLDIKVKDILKGLTQYRIKNSIFKFLKLQVGRI